MSSDVKSSLIWLKNLVTLWLRPVISVNCSFIRASGRGFALSRHFQSQVVAWQPKCGNWRLLNYFMLGTEDLPEAGLKDIQLLFRENRSHFPRTRTSLLFPYLVFCSDTVRLCTLQLWIHNQWTCPLLPTRRNILLDLYAAGRQGQSVQKDCQRWTRPKCQTIFTINQCKVKRW